MTEAKPTILVLAPMPAFPTSAGNRRRVLATCEALKRGGFAVDFAYWAHEDQIYRRFGQHPPTDLAAMETAFQRVFLIEPRATIPLKTRANAFGIDDWCPDAVGDFVAWYFRCFPETSAVLVNYVFLSRVLERVPPGVLTLIDTHDRFAGRQAQYRPFRAEPNFFYTDTAGEAAGLDRADIVLAIQSAEARYFEALTAASVHLLPPHFPALRPFTPPHSIERIGFIGHGNDPNLFSIRHFAQTWAEGWTPDRPELVVAGEICTVLGALDLPGVRLLGYLDRIDAFYEAVDLVVVPMLMGSGLKMKVGEALSYGVPVIGTAIGFEGFDPVDPSHRCRDAEEVKRRVLALIGDATGLAALAIACEKLFADYNTAAEQGEQALMAMLRAPGGSSLSARAPEPRLQGEPPLTETGGGLALSCERSARSLAATHPDLGILVATEREAGGDAAYAPLRRRWFARPDERTKTETFCAVGAVSVALAPEWVRGRALPPGTRAALVAAFSDVRADWTTCGRPVGVAAGRIEIVLDLPSFLTGGRHPSAAFLIAPEGRMAFELRLEQVTPLLHSPRRTAIAAQDAGLPSNPPHLEVPQRSGGLEGGLQPELRSLEPSFEARSRGHLRMRGVSGTSSVQMRDDLTLVPASASFSGYTGSTQPEGRLLLLTDNLIGRIMLVGDAA